MILNKEIYKQVVEFRKRGFTYTEIAKICGVSKSTVSNYVSKKKFSQEVAKDNAIKAARENKRRMLLLNKARKAERSVRYSEALRSAETEYTHYKHSPLFIAGLSFYFSIGDRKDLSRVRVSSTNQDLHRIWLRFLHDFMGIHTENITCIITLYRGMDEEKELRWWSRHIKLSLRHFAKTQFLKAQTAKPTSTQNHGSCSIIIDNTLQKKKLLHWIHLLQKELHTKK